MRKIGFFGTPDLAAHVLEKLINSPDNEVVFVVTNPDKPVGRKQILTPSPVKKLAENYQIPVFTPTKIRDQHDFLQKISDFEADYFVVVAYGRILPTEILEMPKKICINVHGSILPKYRGASPIQSALLAGENETGVTIMKMSEKMDEGDTILIKKIPIDAMETTQTLFQKFEKYSPDALLEALSLLEAQKVFPVAQNHSEATYCQKIQKSDGKIDWSHSVEAIFRSWQAYTPWPGVFAFLDGKRVIFLEMDYKKFRPSAAENGQIIPWEKSFAIVGSDGIILPKKIKIEGKSVQNAEDFFRGNQNILYSIFS